MRSAPQVDMPAEVDSNSPAFRRDGELYLLNSTGAGPVRSSGGSQFRLGAPSPVIFKTINPWPTWMESLWVEPDTGTVFGWYHQEHWGVCGATRLAVPEIGAAVSFDGGYSFQDLGPVLQSGDPYDCGSKNGYFAGGVGDFSVMLDRDGEYFYFLFTNYAGPLESQGVAVARMPADKRYSPSGNVWKYFEGGWGEPGIHGRVTPIFRARASWQSENTNSYWGPSIHWNTYLDSYVMLLNRSCCTTGFPQAGIYASFGKDLSDPECWSRPRRILESTGWYPQVIGTGPQGTDRLAGRIARLYVYGHSYWDIVFEKPDSEEAAPPAQ